MSVGAVRAGGAHFSVTAPLTPGESLRRAAPAYPGQHRERQNSPGVLVTAWYFTAFGLPAMRKIRTTALGAVLSSGPLSLIGAAGALAFALTAASSAFVLWGLAQSLAAMARQVITRPSAAS